METITVKDIFKQRNRAPSIRQVRAVEAYLGDKGGKTKKEALLDAGYSQKVADNPNRVFGSRAVKDLMANNGLAEEDLIAVLKGKVHSDKEHIQMQALDMSFKLHGSYAPKRVESKNDHRVGMFSLADLREEMKKRNFKVTDKKNDTDTRI